MTYHDWISVPSKPTITFDIPWSGEEPKQKGGSARSDETKHHTSSAGPTGGPTETLTIHLTSSREAMASLQAAGKVAFSPKEVRRIFMAWDRGMLDAKGLRAIIRTRKVFSTSKMAGIWEPETGRQVVLPGEEVRELG